MINLNELKLKLAREKNIFRGFYKGFEYWIIRSFYINSNPFDFDANSSLLHFCGYVVIPKNSKYYISKNYYDYNIECHGGLTFGGSLEKYSVDFAIGFDCGHFGDFNNITMADYHELTEYCDEEYVRTQCQSIIQQLIDGNRKF